MVAPNCPRCQTTTFNIGPIRAVKGLVRTFDAIYCSSCGAIIAAFPDDDGDFKTKVKNAIADIQRQIVRR